MRILLPVNLKMWPERLVDAAEPFVARMQAQVDLLYVDELPEPLPHVKDPAVQAVISANWRRAKEEVSAQLHTLMARFPEACRGQCLLDEGSAGAAIVRQSDAYDLVICGNDGRQGIASLFGSMSEQLVRGFRRPVLLLRTRPDR